MGEGLAHQAEGGSRMTQDEGVEGGAPGRSWRRILSARAGWGWVDAVRDGPGARGRLCAGIDGGLRGAGSLLGGAEVVGEMEVVVGSRFDRGWVGHTL